MTVVLYTKKINEWVQLKAEQRKLNRYPKTKIVFQPKKIIRHVLTKKQIQKQLSPLKE